VEGQLALTTIARESSVSASSGNIGETVMVVISKKNDRFTHTVAYRFGQESGYIDGDGNVCAQPVQLSAASCAFRLPESFYEEIPDEPSGQCELVCTTYDGETQIGEAQSCVFTATAEKSRSAPLLSGRVKDVNAATVALTGDEDVLIRYASTALCTVQATPRNGASLKTVQVDGIETPEFVLQMPNAESGSFTFRAVDSRGYESAVVTQNPTVPYVKLTCNVRPGRTDPGTGIAGVYVEGSCYCGSFGVAANTLTLRYAFAGGEVTELTLQPAEDHTYSAQLEIPGLDYTQSYDLLVQAQDQIATVDTTARIGQAIPVFHWGKDYFRFHVPISALSVNDRGECADADAALDPGVYRLTGEGLLLVFRSGDVLAQLVIGASGRKARLITEAAVQDWAAW